MIKARNNEALHVITSYQPQSHLPLIAEGTGGGEERESERGRKIKGKSEEGCVCVRDRKQIERQGFQERLRF